MSKISALKAQVVGASQVALPVPAGVKVDPRLRLALVDALRKSGKYINVSSTEDRRSNPTKVYLALRGRALSDDGYRATIERIASQAGLNLKITLTSGSAYQKRFRVDVLLSSGAQAAPTLFDAVADVLKPAKVAKGTVSIEGTTFTGLTPDAIRQIQGIVDRENLVQIRVVNVNTLSVINLKVPVVVRDALTGKTPRFSFAGRYGVLTAQGLTILTVDGSKYVLAS